MYRNYLTPCYHYLKAILLVMKVNISTPPSQVVPWSCQSLFTHLLLVREGDMFIHSAEWLSLLTPQTDLYTCHFTALHYILHYTTLYTLLYIKGMCTHSCTPFPMWLQHISDCVLCNDHIVTHCSVLVLVVLIVFYVHMLHNCSTLHVNKKMRTLWYEWHISIINRLQDMVHSMHFVTLLNLQYILNITRMIREWW